MKRFFTRAMFGLVPLSLAPVQAAELLAYYDFDDASDPAQAVELTGNARNASLVGAVFTADAGGATGNPGDRALDVSAANARAEVPAGKHLESANLNDALAVSFWQQQPSIAATSTFWINSPSLGGDQRGAQAHVPWSNGIVYFDTSGCCAVPAQRQQGATGSVTVNTWNHFVFQKDAAGNKQVWLNGTILLDQVGGAASLLEFDGRFGIGGAIGGANSFNGLIDDFAIYNDALTPTEIADLAAGTSQPDDIANPPLDTDGDGIPDFWEDLNGLDKNDASDGNGDGDSDGLTTAEEYRICTDFTNPDTDGDGLLDGVEDPTLPFVDANQPGTSPLLADTDGDKFLDGVEIDGGSDPTDAGSIPAPKPLSILAWWDFNDVGDPANAVDKQNGHVGLLENGSAYSADMGGRTGANGDYAMDFGGAGSQTVRVPDASFLNDATIFDEVTISFWQKLSSAANNSAFWGNSPSSGGSSRGIQAHVPNGGIIYYDSSGCCAGNQRISKNAGAIDFLNWRHLAFVKKGDLKEIWVDGALFHSGTGAAPLPIDFDQFFIGSSNAPAASVQGVMDDFAIFSRALRPDQISLLAAGSSPTGLLDSDQDGIDDESEVAAGLDPLDPDDATEDANGNGLSNLLEHTWGLNPGNPAPIPIVDADVAAGTLSAPGGPRTDVQNTPNGVDFSVVFTRRVDAAPSGLNVEVQFSANLTDWFPNTSGDSVLDTDGVVELVKVSYPFALPNGRKARYWRIVVN